MGGGRGRHKSDVVVGDDITIARDEHAVFGNRLQKGILETEQNGEDCIMWRFGICSLHEVLLQITVKGRQDTRNAKT